MFLFNFQDPSYTDDNLKNYILSVKINPRTVEFCYTDKSFRKIVRSAKLDHSSIEEKRLNQLLQELKPNECFSYTVCIFNELFTLVPEQLYTKDNEAELLNYTLPERLRTDLVFSNRLSQYGLQCIFSVDSSFNKTLGEIFQPSQLFHCSTSTITAFAQNKDKGIKTVFVNFVDGKMEVVRFKADGKLLFYNIFSINTAEDVLYYLLYSIKTTTPDTMPERIVLAGDIEKEANIFLLLKKYFSTLIFQESNPVFEYSTALGELAPHRCYCLYNQSLCVSSQEH